MDLLEDFAPKEYACSWDNVGLLIGRKNQEIKNIVVALDATNEVINQAIELDADLLVTHHPMIFSSMKRVNDEDFLGEKILKLVENKIAVFAMHTNFDVIGMADLSARYLDFPEDAKPFDVTVQKEDVLEGIGKITTLKEETTLLEYARFVKEKLSLDQVLLFGKEDRKVKVVATSPGSGRSMIKLAAKLGVDVLVTGDIGHHEGLDALDMGVAIIEAGHYGTEYIFIDYVTKFLQKKTNACVTAIKAGSPYKVIG